MKIINEVLYYAEDTFNATFLNERGQTVAFARIVKKDKTHYVEMFRNGPVCGRATTLTLISRLNDVPVAILDPDKDLNWRLK